MMVPKAPPPDPVLLVADDGMIIHAFPPAPGFFARASHELLARPFELLLAAPDRRPFRVALRERASLAQATFDAALEHDHAARYRFRLEKVGPIQFHVGVVERLAPVPEPRADDAPEVQQLRVAQERYELALRGSSDVLWDWDIPRNRLYLAPRLTAVLGLEPKDFPTDREQFLDLLHPEDRAAFDAAAYAHTQHRLPFAHECRARHADGTERWILVRGQAVWNERGEPVRLAGSITDTTSRRRTEAALRESEERLRFALECADAGTYEFDLQRRTLAWSASMYRLLGIAPDLYSSPLDAWMALVDPRDHEQAVHDFARLTAAHREEHFATYRLHHPTLGERWIADKGRVIYNAQGRPERLVGVFMDVTDRRRVELALEQAQERLDHVRQMEALALIAGGVAHDFNNLLMAIRGHAALARESLSTNHEAAESLDQVEHAARQAATVANTLRAFVKRPSARLEPIDLDHVVSITTRLFRRAIPQTVRLVSHIHEGPPLRILGDELQIQHALMTLMLRARDAVEDSGTIRVALDPAPQSHATLEVSHTGAPLSEDTRAGLNNPDAILDPRSDLRSIRDIVHDHAATIRAEQTQGDFGGATITLTFPLLAAEPKPTTAHPTPPAHKPLPAKVAVQSDIVSALVSSMLVSLRYQPEPVAARAAIEFVIDPASEGVAVMDAALLDDHALDMLRRAKGGRARLVVLAPPVPVDSPLCSWLQKPFQFSDLRRLLVPGPSRSPA
jgi:PAS domain S-box-containing protein